MRRLAVLSAAVLLLSACSEGQPEPATGVSSLHVTGHQEQDQTSFALLSPDGGTLLYSGKGLCLSGVDGSNDHCRHIPPAHALDSRTADWSPDDSTLAITEAFWFGVEPDVWVIDVASGEQTNLTDDGVEQAELDAPLDFALPADSVIDAYPSWSADGQRIRFLRAEPDGMALMSVPVGGGEPTRLGTINTDWRELQTVAWTENSIAWMSGPRDDSDSEVWVSSASGGNPHKVLDGPYRTLSFSSDGALLLADQVGGDGEGKIGAARVVPARGGDAVPVAPGGVQYPTWAPKGHAIAYVDKAVKVVGKPGDKPRVLYEGKELGAADHRNLDWALGTILVRTGRDTPVVLRIDG